MSTKRILSWVLAGAVWIFCGLLSVVGLCAIFPSISCIILAIAGFSLTVVEMRVYKQNIFKGLKRLKLLVGSHGLKELLVKKWRQQADGLAIRETLIGAGSQIENPIKPLVGCSCKTDGSSLVTDEQSIAKVLKEAVQESSEVLEGADREANEVVKALMATVYKAGGSVGTLAEEIGTARQAVKHLLASMKTPVYADESVKALAAGDAAYAVPVAPPQLIDTYSKLRKCYQHIKSQNLDPCQTVQQDLKELLTLIEQHLVSQVLDNHQTEYISKEEVFKLRRKLWGLRLASVFISVAGVSAGLLAVLNAFAVLHLTLLAPVAWPLVALALLIAMGYSLVIYQTLAEILVKNLLLSWYERLKQAFSRRPGQSMWQYSLKGLCGVFVIGFIIAVLAFGTYAAACTGWHTLLKGLGSLLPPFYAFVLPILCLAPYVVCDWVFRFKNVSVTIVGLLTQNKKAIWKALKKPYIDAFKQFKSRWAQGGNLVQQAKLLLRLLFQWTKLLFMALFTLAHLIGEAATNNDATGVSRVLTTVLSFIEGACIDVLYVYPSDSASTRDYNNQADTTHSESPGMPHLAIHSNTKAPTEPVDSPLHPPLSEKSKQIPTNSKKQASDQHSTRNPTFWRVAQSEVLDEQQPLLDSSAQLAI